MEPRSKLVRHKVRNMARLQALDDEVVVIPWVGLAQTGSPVVVPDTVPMQARDSRSSRAHTQCVCARVPPFRALVPLAGALLEMSLPLYYRVAAFEQFCNGSREPSRARARGDAHARRPA